MFRAKESSSKSYDIDEEKNRASKEVMQQLVIYISIVAAIRVTPLLINYIN